MRLAVLPAVVISFLAAGAAPARADDTYAPDVLRRDFAALYEELQAADYDLYAFTPRATMDRAYRETLAGLGAPLTKDQAAARFQDFVAKAHQAHARIDFPYAQWSEYLQGGGKAFPFEVRIVGDRLFVAQNRSGEDAIASGDEILDLNGISARRWLDRLCRHISAESPYFARSILELDFAPYLRREIGEPAEYRVTIRTARGAVKTLAVPSRTRAQMRVFAAQQPPLLDLSSPLRDARMLTGKVAYLRPGPFYNAEARTGAEEWDVSGFRNFIDGAFDRFLAAGADKLIVDLRGNPGGDNLFSDVMIAWFANKPFRFFSRFEVKVSPQSTQANAERIVHDAAAAGPVSQQYARMYAQAPNGAVVDFELAPAVPHDGRRFTGRVYVLVDRHSYSNAVSVAALIQDYRFGTILGEETADVCPAYGAMEQFSLPGTGIVVGYPKARIERPRPGPTVRGVLPDVVLPTPIVEIAADSVLQNALELASKP